MGARLGARRGVWILRNRQSVGRGEQHRIRAATNFDSRQPFEGRMTTLEWTRIIKAIEPLELWQPAPPLPTHRPSDTPIDLYHGSSYVLEGRKGSGYRAMWMELKDLQKFERLGGVMLSLGNHSWFKTPHRRRFLESTAMTGWPARRPKTED